MIMRSDKERLKHPAAVRACSLLLVLLILCSAFVMQGVSGVDAVTVGAVPEYSVMTGDQPAKAKVQVQTVGATPNVVVDGTKIYIDLSLTVGWWSSDSSAKPALYCWNDNNGTGKTNFLAEEDKNVHLYSYTFDDDFTGIIIGSAISESTTGYSMVGDKWQKTKDITYSYLNGSLLASNDCIKVLADGSGTERGVEISSYQPPTPAGGNYYTSKIGYEDRTTSTGYGDGNGVTLFPVPVTFYDYYTDYEHTNGWRSVIGQGNDASRTCGNSFPFKKFNTYLSNMANDNPGWQVPLYFGNFFTGSKGVKAGHYYNVGQQTMLFNGTGDTGETGNPAGSNKSADLYKFSAQANNSMYLSGLTGVEGGYSTGAEGLNIADRDKYSVIGLANNVLTDGKLTMGTGSVEAPYFSDATVDAGHATKVTAQFPFRVEDETLPASKVYYVKNNSPSTTHTCKSVWLWGGNKSARALSLDRVDGYKNLYQFTTDAEFTFKNIILVDGVVSDSTKFPTNVTAQSRDCVWDGSNVLVYSGWFSGNGYDADSAFSTEEIGDDLVSDIAGATYKTYSFDSTGGKDNVYFSGYGSATNDENTSLKLNYSTSTKTIDAHSGFGGSEDGIGFFPFDNEGGAASTNAYDFGFGMRLDIPFMVTDNGMVGGTNVPIKFSFSGDDDVWVFVDDKLALDLGGDHCKAEGEINFATKQATIKTGAYQLKSTVCDNPNQYYAGTAQFDLGGVVTADTVTKALPGGIDWTPNKVHTLSVFYMERGMSESNLKMEFTMTPLDNVLVTENEVVVDGVNAGLKTAVENAVKNDTSTVTYTETRNGNSVNIGDYTYTKNDGSEHRISDYNNNNPLNFDESNTFNGQFNSGSDITSVLNFSADNKYSYSTTYRVTDEYLGTEKSSGNGTAVPLFNFKTTDASYLAIDYFKIAYKNTINTVPVTISKTVQFADGTVDKTNIDRFEFTVKVKLPGETDYKIYQLDYSKSDATTGKLDAEGKVKIKHGENIVIQGIPVGSSVKVYETPDPSVDSPRYVVVGTHEREIENLQSAYEFAYINQYAGNPPAGFNAEAEKIITLNGDKRTITGDDIFTFSLEECNQGGNVIQGGKKLTATNDGNGIISFAKIEYGQQGTYYYKITEAENADKSEIYEMDKTAYWIKVDVKFQNSVWDETLKVNIDYSTVTGTYYSDQTMANKIAKVVFYTEAYKDNGQVKGTTSKTVYDANDQEVNKLTGVVFTNKIRVGNLKLNKTFSDLTTDAQINAKLDNLKTVEFAYYKVSGNNVTPASDAVPTGTITKDNGSPTVENNSLVFTAENLEVGWYAVKETKAPSGYELKTGYTWVEIKENKTTEAGAGSDPAVGDQDNTASIENIKSTNLPESGGMGVAIFVVVGVVLVIVGVLLLKPKKKKADSPSGKSDADSGESS